MYGWDIEKDAENLQLKRIEKLLLFLAQSSV